MDESITKTPDKTQQKLNKLDILVFNNGWNDKNEQLIVNIGYNAGVYKKLHDKSALKYIHYNKILNISLLIFSIFLSTDSILNILQGEILTIIQKIITFIVAFISVLNNFLKYEEKSTQHKQSSQAFNLIYNDIRNMMCIYRKDRTNAVKYIQNIIKEYDYLEISSPEISSYLIKQIKEEIEHDSNIKNKNIMPNNTVKEIEVLVDKNENTYNITNNNFHHDSSSNNHSNNHSDTPSDTHSDNHSDNHSHQINLPKITQPKFKINNKQNLEDIHQFFRIDGDLSENDNITFDDIQNYRNYSLNLQTQYQMNRFMH